MVTGLFLNGIEAFTGGAFWIFAGVVFASAIVMVSFPRAAGFPGLIVILTLIMGASWVVSDYEPVPPGGVTFDFRVIRLDVDRLTIEVLPDGPLYEFDRGALELSLRTLQVPRWFLAAGSEVFVRYPWDAAEANPLREDIRSRFPVLFASESRHAKVERPVLFAVYRVRIDEDSAVTISRREIAELR
ncbi:MAG: hypothetical protein EA383_00575 [Spirochaetaceae bacterium]|nr:MAG: hypothetical protein EA383_00575 [Spirochaetaceae bacterium]